MSNITQSTKSILSLNEIKNIIFPVCEKYKVKNAYIFGSYAKGNATYESDVDLHLVFDRKPGLLTLNRINTELETVLQKKVDIITHFPKQQGISFYKNFETNVHRDEVLLYANR